jgi:septum formation inhibitor-activating ATPase MinD
MQHAGCQIIAFVGVSGGLGLSTLASLLAWTFVRRRLRCTIVDADITGGGLDVLLGIEAESGMRFGDISAPLGQLDGTALYHELPSWERIGVLSVNPWNAACPDWWEQQAAITALQEVNDVLVIDAGLGVHLGELALPPTVQTVLLTELSVLGLARTKALLKSDNSRDNSVQPLLVGIHPRSMPRQMTPLSLDEAQDYLGVELIGVMSWCKRLSDSMLSGFGIPRIPKQYLPLLDVLADAVLNHQGENSLHVIEQSRSEGALAKDGRKQSSSLDVERARNEE